MISVFVDANLDREVLHLKIAIWPTLLLLGQFNSTWLAQSTEDIAKQFAGMWRLVSDPQRHADGTTREGSNSVGYAFF